MKNWEKRTGETANVACPFDDGELEAKADTEEGDLLLPCPLDREHHALCSSLAEAARYENTPEVDWLKQDK